VDPKGIDYGRSWTGIPRLRIEISGQSLVHMVKKLGFNEVHEFLD